MDEGGRGEMGGKGGEKEVRVLGEGQDSMREGKGERKPGLSPQRQRSERRKQVRADWGVRIRVGMTGS